MKSVNLILFRDDLIKDLEYDKQLLNLSNDLEQKQRVFDDYVNEMEKNTKEQNFYSNEEVLSNIIKEIIETKKGA